MAFLPVTGRAQEKPSPILELEKLIIGGWGKVSNTGFSSINDEALQAAALSCRQTKRMFSVSYGEGAVQTIPDEGQRRGNVVYYRTLKGLQRLDTAIRKVLLVQRVKGRILNNGRKVWDLHGPEGTIIVTFGQLKRGDGIIDVLVEGNSILLRCEAASTR